MYAAKLSLTPYILILKDQDTTENKQQCLEENTVFQICYASGFSLKS
jgi:hypothetical protein